MNEYRLIRTIANDLPGLIRQVESGDPALLAAAVQRLRDFAQMTEPLRAGVGGRTVSRRGLLRAGAGAVTFAAMAFKDD